MRKILNFMNLNETDKNNLLKAIDFSSFQNMRKMEKLNFFNDERLKPGDINNIGSYKTRKGKVKGYLEELSRKDIEYVDEKTKKLNSIYNY